MAFGLRQPGATDGYLTGGFAGWHRWSGSATPVGPFAYINLPYVSDAPGNGWTVPTGPAGLFTAVASHEYAEAVTDPSGSGWGDSQGYEIGDMCGGEGFELQLSTGWFWVQSEWSNRANNATGACATQDLGAGIVNGTFENGLQGWGTIGAAAITADAHNGGSALKLSAMNTGTAGYTHAAQYFTAPPGFNWLSFWYKQNCQGSSQDSYTFVLLNMETRYPEAPEGDPTKLTKALVPQTCTVRGWTQAVAPITPGIPYYLDVTNGSALVAGSNWTVLDDVRLTATQPLQFTEPDAGLTVTDNGSAATPGLSLQWAAQPGAQSYTVLRNGSPIQSGITGTGWTDYSAVANTAYAYSLDEVDSAAAVSGPSAPVSGTLSLPAVTGVVAHGPGNAIQISWNAQLGTSYNVYRDGTEIQAGIVSPSWIDTGATVSGKPPHQYTITVMRGVSESPASAAATWVDPNAPTGVSVTPGLSVKTAELDVSWNPVPGASSYNVYRDGVKVFSTTGTSYPDKTVQADTSYSYAVSAVVAGVESGRSLPDNAYASGGGGSGGICKGTTCS